MARKDSDALGVGAAETIIGSGVEVKGNLAGDGDMIIDGNMSGDISCTGNVTIGVNGVVKATMKALNVVIAGHVTGNISASGEITIRESGQLHGNIRAESLAIVSGGVFNGTSHLTTSATSEA